jgi:hypothetical protein
MFECHLWDHKPINEHGWILDDFGYRVPLPFTKTSSEIC